MFRLQTLPRVFLCLLSLTVMGGCEQHASERPQASVAAVAPSLAEDSLQVPATEKVDTAKAAVSVGNANLSQNKTGADGFQAELGERFLSAMQSVVRAPIEDWDEGGLLALRFLERDFGLQANAEQRIALVMQGGRMLPGIVRVNPQGLAAQQPVEKKLGLDWLREQTKFPTKLSDEAIVTFGTVSAVNHCLPAEADYNAKFLDHVDTLAWPEGMAWIRFGLYAGFRLHNCIGEAEFRRHAEPFMKPLMAWMSSPGSTADKQAYVLFALAVSDRLSDVPSDFLIRFVRAQSPDGMWQSESVGAKPVNGTALGAYVIAKTLTSAGYELPEKDFRIATDVASLETKLPNPRGEDSK